MRSCLISALFACMVLVVGCHSAKRPHEGQPDPLPPDEYPQIATLEGLKGYVVIGDVVTQQGPPLEVSVSVRARTDKELNVQYRFVFLDSKSLPLDADPDWRYITMPARTQAYMRANALDSNAVDWRLEIRPAR